MPRVNKKTRIRQLSPRLQLQERDALTGSYPTTVRLASDNRSGKYNINFNDLNTVNFITYPSGSIISSVSGGASNPEHLGLEYDPIALYTFDGDIEDTSGNNFDLSLVAGTLQFDDGPFSGSQALFLDSNSYLSSAIESALQVTGALTIQSFFKTSKISDSGFTIRYYIAAMGGVKEDLTQGLISNTLYSLAVNPSGSDGLVSGSTGFVLERALGDDYIGEQTGSIISINEWYHLAVSRNTSNISTVYLNGINVGTFNHSTPTFPQKDTSGNIQRLYVGYKPFIGEIGEDFNLEFSGSISNLKIVPRALTDEEILAEYQKVTTGSAGSTAVTTSVGLLGGIGFPIQSNWIQNRTQLDLPVSGIISTPGTVRSQVIEGQPFFHFTPGQDLTPFKENNNPALDGLSSTSSFYEEGSPVNLVGEGFDQPLWSKSKIQIKLPVATVNNTIQTFVSGGRNLDSGASNNPASGSVQKVSGGPLSNESYNSVGLSYPMAYYNFNNQCWEGIGRGEALCYTTINTSTVPDNFNLTRTIGFSQGLINTTAELLDTGISGAFEYMAGAGHPISNYAFPYDARYHATSSQRIKMNDYINEPFLVEKIVVDLSGTFAFNSENYTTGTLVTGSSFNPATVISSAFPGAINNFFVLVQRSPYSFRKNTRVYLPVSEQDDLVINSTLPTNIVLTNAGGTTFINTTRDLLSYGGISSFAANTPTNVFRSGTVGIVTDNTLGIVYNATPQSKNVKQLMTRDFVFTSSQDMVDNLTPLNWNGKVRLELGSYNSVKVSSFFGVNEVGNGITSSAQVALCNENNDFGGRNGLGITNPTGRDLNSPITSIAIEGTSNNGRTGHEVILTNPDAHKKYGGYILQPEDSLVFGWQQPLPAALSVDASNRHVNDGILSTMTFGSSIITIYGSLIREGKEYHDILNQLLSSDAINEVIE